MHRHRGESRSQGTVEDVLAILAPGQGAQTPGMLTPWLDLPGAVARMQWFSALAGVDLIQLGTAASAEEIRDTAVTQPLIVALGLLAAAELPLADVGIVAGHSVGELTASAMAGVLSMESAVALAGLRGREMARACGEAQTGMSALLGGDPDEVVAAIAAAGLAIANINGAGQVVAAGTVEGLAALAANPPARSKVVSLPVAGAFHTPYMASAETALAAVADGVGTGDPGPILLSNADGAAVPTGDEMVKRMVRQVTVPVRWDLCQATLRDLGVTAIVELPPTGTLAGLAKRELRGSGVEILAVKTPADLATARELIARSAPAHQAQHTPDWRVVVCPAVGTLRRADITEGSALQAGTQLGSVLSRQPEQQVFTPYSGVLIEWLAEDGDLVDAGDPLARLEPAGAT
jgi:[acyl-carrier-protein] S-malonyltransferase